MKVELKKEIIYEKVNNTHNCSNHVEFSDYLEKSIEKNRDDLSQKLESEKDSDVSIFAEKKTGKNRTDIFDTLIDV